MEIFVAFASTLFCKALVCALIIALIVIWLCMKVIKNEKIKTGLIVGLLVLTVVVCFVLPVYCMEKTKDIPYQMISCNKYNIVKLQNGNMLKGERITAVVQDESGKTKNISFYSDRFDIGSSEGEKHLQVFEETTGASYIEEKFMEKKNPLIQSQYWQIVVHLSKEDKKKIK